MGLCITLAEKINCILSKPLQVSRFGNQRGFWRHNFFINTPSSSLISAANQLVDNQQHIYWQLLKIDLKIKDDLLPLIIESYF